jgi:hypothetical protein
MTIGNNGPQDRPPGTQPDSGNDPSPASPEDVSHNLAEAVRSALEPARELSAAAITRNYPDAVGSDFDVFLGSDGYPYALPDDIGNLTVLRLGTKAGDAFLRERGYQRGRILKTPEVRDASDTLIAHAELSRDIRDVWVRVAPYEDGFEIDLGDANHTRVRVTANRVEVLTSGSKTLFWRPPTQRPLPAVPEEGNIGLWRKYVNLHATEQILLETLMVYVIAHPKLSTTVYVILLLLGPQGAGKSVLTRLIQALIDPSGVGLQILPRNPRDLGIAAPQAHLLCYDNSREIPELMSDNLCLTSTGGSINTRRLYTDSDQVTLQLRVAVLLNSLHPILDQPDLAQRCLPLTLQPIDARNRRSEKDLMAEFEADRPAIFRGLLDRAAAILAELPNGAPMQPERMAEFSAWLSAAERVDGAPPGVYEDQYARVLTAGMRDALLENPLAAAVMGLLEGRKDHAWSGTPAELLEVLECHVSRRMTYSPAWPRTPSALSKRLLALSGGLARQGVEIEFGRGRERRISLSLREDFDHE